MAILNGIITVLLVVSALILIVTVLFPQRPCRQKHGCCKEHIQQRKRNVQSNDRKDQTHNKNNSKNQPGIKMTHN